MSKYSRCPIAALFAFMHWAIASAAPTFTNVIKIPPDPIIGNHGSIGSNTQLNLFGGGSIGTNFDAGAAFGTQNIEVNIQGGMVGNQFFAGSGSVVNLLGGNPLGLFAAGSDSIVNIAGGGIGTLSDVEGNSVLNLFVGYIGTSFSARFSSMVNIYGGVVDAGFTAANNSVVNIYGGAIQNDFNAVQNSSVHIFGRRFFLELTEISQTMVPGVPRTVTERDVRLHGSFADGSPFSFELNSSINFFGQDFFAPTATLTVTLVPEPASMVLVLMAITWVNWRRRLS